MPTCHDLFPAEHPLSGREHPLARSIGSIRVRWSGGGRDAGVRRISGGAVAEAKQHSTRFPRHRECVQASRLSGRMGVVACRSSRGCRLKRTQGELEHRWTWQLWRRRSSMNDGVRARSYAQLGREGRQRQRRQMEHGGSGCGGIDADRVRHRWMRAWRGRSWCSVRRAGQLDGLRDISPPSDEPRASRADEHRLAGELCDQLRCGWRYRGGR
jgi:hypothetical protein